MFPEIFIDAIDMFLQQKIRNQFLFQDFIVTIKVVLKYMCGVLSHVQIFYPLDVFESIFVKRINILFGEIIKIKEQIH